MRPEDSAFAAEVGAAYVGAVFAGGPRHLAPEQAARIFHSVPSTVRRVAVVGADFRDTLPDILRVVRPDVVQLHGDPDVRDVRDARVLGAPAVWAAVRIAGTAVPAVAADLFGEADALLLDARVAGGLGGTGTPLPWPALAEVVGRIRSGGTLVLAGGLTPANVSDAIAALDPDVVDVSSGVERAPGVKDHELMVQFAYAARGATR
jgi:phosphoribosylanthranilate isomerase